MSSTVKRTVLLVSMWFAAAAGAATCPANLDQGEAKKVARAIQRSWREALKTKDEEKVRRMIERAMARGAALYAWSYTSPTNWYLQYPPDSGEEWHLGPIEGRWRRPPLPQIRPVGEDHQSSYRSLISGNLRTASRTRFELLPPPK